MRAWTVAVVLTLAGCDLVEQGQDVFDGLTNPLVAEGAILGIEAPEGEIADALEGSDFEEGTAVTVFLADAQSVDEIEEAPVEGASVSLRGSQIGSVSAEDAGEGAYYIGPQEGVAYVQGAEWTVAVDIGGDLSTVTMDLPPVADPTVPEQHTKGAALAVDLTGMGFDSVLLVVIDGQNQEVTYSNEPTNAKELYDFTHGQEEVTTVTIPGTAFGSESIYAVGVAGMVHSASQDFDGMNTALSTIMAGKMRFHPVSTVTMP